MKQILILTIVCAILCSCKKEQIPLLKTQISGKWQYLRTISPEITSPPLADTANNIIIGSDGSFERRYNDSAFFKGTYSLTEKKDCYGDENKFLFKTSDQPSGTGDYIRVNHDTLILSSPNCYLDGGVLFYIRK